MLAHCNVTYEMVYDNIHPKPKGFQKWLMKAFVKKIVVSEKPYKKNNRTAPAFIVTQEKNFKEEKDRLVDYLNKTQELGADHFDKKESHPFGPFSKN